MIRAEIRRFADVLGRAVSETERGSIPTFNDMPPSGVEEARLVRLRGGRISARDYLRFFVKTQREHDADSFCEDVLEGGADAKTWRIEDCVVGVVEARCEGISLTVEQYVSALDGIQGERWFRTERTDLSAGSIPMSQAGPGTLIREMHYWSTLSMPNPAASIQRLAIDPSCTAVRKVPDGSLELTIRRWMSSVAAWWSSKYLLTNAMDANVEGVLAAYPEQVTPSLDGLVAIRALVREARSGDPRWPSQVGFIGPDEWYRP